MGSTLTALTGAMHSDTLTDLAAITTLAVTLSGVTILSVGAAFWGLLAGSAVCCALAPRRKRPRQTDAGKEAVVAA